MTPAVKEALCIATKGGELNAGLSPGVQKGLSGGAMHVLKPDFLDVQA